MDAVSADHLSEKPGVVELNLSLPLIKAFTPRFPRLAVKLNEPFSIRVPAVKERFPFMPLALFCFNIMLMIPPSPWASYLAPGLVITSILLIWLAGIDCSTSAILLPNAVEGLPLIRKRILVLPASSTLPSASTDTCGTFFKISVATPPCEVRSFSALNTSLSILLSIKPLLAVTVTFCNVDARFCSTRV